MKKCQEQSSSLRSLPGHRYAQKKPCSVAGSVAGDSGAWASVLTYQMQVSNFLKPFEHSVNEALRPD